MRPGPSAINLLSSVSQGIRPKERREMGKSAEQLRGEAVAHRQEARDSFERCDTDGFLSQWASGINARLCEAQAAIAENGGKATFARWVLTRIADGEVMDVKTVRTRYGAKWRIDATDEWITEGSERAAKRRGYAVTEVIEQAEAAACIAGSGTGLSDATSCYIRTYRKDAAATDGWRGVGIAGDERSR